MNDQQLERNLRSVGMTCFVNYFHEFASRSLPNDAVAGILLEGEIRPELGGQRKRYTENSCRSRVSHARSIINAGRAQCALGMIAVADRLRLEVRKQAEALAKELSGR